MIYFTSDTHVFHKNILQHQADTRPFNSIEEMNATIVDNWNSTVNKGDDVYHLGDLAFRGKREEIFNLIYNLNGRIHLVRGNHDHFKPYELKLLFTTVQDYKVVRYNKQRIVCMHYPLEEWDKCHYGDIHLHGHCHGNLKRKLPNRFDIGWDVHQRLVPIEEVLSWKSEDRVTHHGEVLA